MPRLSASARSIPQPQPPPQPQADGIGPDLAELRLATVSLDVNGMAGSSRRLEELRLELGELCRRTMNLSRRLDRGGADELFYDVCFLVRVRIAEERRMLAIDACSAERTRARLKRTRAELHRALALLADAFAGATWIPVRIPRRSEINAKAKADSPARNLAAMLNSADRADPSDTAWVLGVAETELALVESHPAFETLPAHLGELVSSLRSAIAGWDRSEHPPALGRLLHARVHALVETLTD